MFTRCHTFEVDPDDVAVAHQVAAGQQLRHFRGVRADHFAHSVADDAVGAETQAGVRIHPKHVLLQSTRRYYTDSFKYGLQSLFITTSLCMWLSSQRICFNIHIMAF